MAKPHAYIAVDLGAESGRVVKGTLAEGKLSLEDVGRFPNGMVAVHEHYYWNLLRLYEEIVKAFKQCSVAKVPCESIGVDTWGVDFALLSEDEKLMGQPMAYRDSRTDGMMDKLFKLVPKEKVYEKTGIQFMKINTIYHLLALARAKSPALKNAKYFMMVPDFFNYLFTGKITNEYTDATTTQCVNVKTRKWDKDILKAIGVDPAIMQDFIEPGTVIGPITKELQNETGLGAIPVVAPGTHDTASAVVAVPAEDKKFAYISSGTWSLMGIEADKPMATEKAFKYNFTNEGGVFGTIRFLKNIMGLWLVQRCRAAFDKEIDYGTLTQMAAKAPAFVSLIDPDRETFLNPASMTQAITEFCKKTKQPAPTAEGAFVRCCLESLALQYRLVMRQLEELYETTFDTLHIVGGGTQNKLLNQLTADATGKKVVTGPIEATIIGNIMMQAIGLGHLSSLNEARQVVRQSFELETYTPQDTKRWDEQFERFMKLKT